MHICKRLDTCLVRLRAWWLFGVICLSISTRFHDVKERARRCFVAYAVQRLLKLCTGVIFDVMSRDIASIPRDTTQVKRLDHACSPIDTHLAPTMHLQIIQSVAPSSAISVNNSTRQGFTALPQKKTFLQNSFRCGGSGARRAWRKGRDPLWKTVIQINKSCIWYLIKRGPQFVLAVSLQIPDCSFEYNPHRVLTKISGRGMREEMKIP